MKLKLWLFIKRHSILRKTFFWLFSVMGMSVRANALYSCKACPNGYQSNPGARLVTDCFDPKTKASTSTIFDKGITLTTIFNGAKNPTSGVLTPGWYRISIRGSNGADTDCSYSYREYHLGFKRRTYTGTKSCSGGAGGTKYYVFYVKNSATYTYEYNSGSPRFTATEDGKRMVFTANKGEKASYSSKSYTKANSKRGVDYFSGTYCECSSQDGKATVTGLFSNSFESSNIDNFIHVGAKLTKL